MRFKVLGLTLAMMLSSVVSADDAPEKKKKAQGRNNPLTAIMRQFKEVELTDDQQSKIEAMAKKTLAAMKEFNEKAGLTEELLKKRAEAQKELRDSGKKAGELMAAVNEKAGLTEAQATALKKSNQMRQKMFKDAVALLSDDQKAKLPKRTQQVAARKAGGKPANDQKKGKKKKEAA